MHKTVQRMGRAVYGVRGTRGGVEGRECRNSVLKKALSSGKRRRLSGNRWNIFVIKEMGKAMDTRERVLSAKTTYGRKMAELLREETLESLTKCARNIFNVE